MAKFQFQFDDTEDCRLYIGSDFHLNHARDFMWGKRGFGSAQEHTDAIINHVNATCRQTDILLHLGDFCLNTPPHQLEALVGRINCQMWWLKGNHNNPWEKLYQEACEGTLATCDWNTSWSYDSNISDYFKPEITGLKLFPNVTIWGSYLEFVWNKQPCVFNHYPYLVWNQRHHGSWSLCGHSHGSCAESTVVDTTMKQLDNCWELHNGILTFQQIRSIMYKKQVGQSDHHDKDVN